MANKDQETELSLYARISDPESLYEADLIEDHIQLESTLISGARNRVRKITPVKGGAVGGTVRYVQALKIEMEPVGGVASCREVTVDVDRAFFEAFASVANRGIVKRRFTFIGGVPKISGAENIVLPPVKYEVDQFSIPGKNGEKSEWIKLDIELDEIIDALENAGIDISGVRQRFDLSYLPFTSEDMFYAATATPEQKALLGKLWETEFAQKIAPDVFVKGNEPAAPAPEPTQPAPTPSPDQQAEDTQKVNGDETEQEQTEEETETP